MDIDRLIRIFERMMETNDTLYMGVMAAIAAIVVLLLLVLINRRRRKAKTKRQRAEKLYMAPEIDDIKDDIKDDADIDMMMIDDSDLPMPEDIVPAPSISEAGADNEADALIIDEPDANPPTGFMAERDDLAELDDLDDITIPKVGEAPPPKKSRIFSSSWQQRNTPKDTSATVSLDMSPTTPNTGSENTNARALAAECARLDEIERKLIALRELYEAGLIAPEVYVLKAREFAAEV